MGKKAVGARARTVEMESFDPDVAVRRKILEGKRDQWRAQAYEMTVNAGVAELLGEPAEQPARLAKKFYAAARHCQKLLDELPNSPAGPDDTATDNAKDE